MQVPHITQQQANAMWANHIDAKESLVILNKRIDKFNAEQSQEQHITAEEARKLGAGNAEFQYNDGMWKVCSKWCVYNANEGWKYRASKQPEPVEPHAELKANLVKLNGKLMSREAAIAEWEAKKDTCDVWYTSDLPPNGEWELDRNFSGKYSHNWNSTNQVKGAQYELHERPLKQISWKDVPVGVAVQDKRNGVVWLYMGSSELEAVLVNIPSRPFCSRFIELTDLELAPADQQPWIAKQDGIDYPLIGFTYIWKKDVFRITGIAKGYELK